MKFKTSNENENNTTMHKTQIRNNAVSLGFDEKTKK